MDLLPKDTCDALWMHVNLGFIPLKIVNNQEIALEESHDTVGKRIYFSFLVLGGKNEN